MKTIHIIEDNLPIAWEKAVVACWEQGDCFPTQYDKEGDPNSRDVLAMIHVKNPFAEPRIHRAFPGGLGDLEKYRAEVLDGVHDHWVNPKEGKWEYTYHERLFKYDNPVMSEIIDGRFERTVSKCWQPKVIDQIQSCINMLKKCGYTRRAQAITWKPWEDLGISDPACLQRLWFRVQKLQGVDRLNMTIHMRSNDAYKAAYMNMYAFTELQKYVAEQVGVEPGEYVHIADSFHIYGSYFKEFQSFLKLVEKRKVEDRVWSSSDENFVIPSFVEGCEELLREENMPEDKRALVLERKKVLTSLL